MPGFADLKHLFGELGLKSKPVIAHAGLKKFGNINGGTGAVIQAMRDSFNALIMPTFTYKAMLTPDIGPPDNGIIYGSDRDLNKMAEPFHNKMPADAMMGKLPQALMNEKDSMRTSHPILSFAGLRADEYLHAQTMLDPFAPIGALAKHDGWVVLINVDQTSNTSIHYGEKLAGRRQFVRWALLPDRIVECPGYAGDSSGFNAIEKHILPFTRRVDMEGGAFIQAIALKHLFEITVDLIKKNPLALLCQRSDCEMCNAVRKS